MKAKIKLFGARIENQKWIFYKVDCEESSEFWTIWKTSSNANDIFFLATQKEFEQQCSSVNQLMNLNTFTKTDPHFRANLQLSYLEGGFSSYQSDYPFEMTMAKGDIVSNINSVGNATGQENGVFLRNIYHLPILKTFYAYLIDSRANKVLNKFEMKTNSSNYIDLSGCAGKVGDYIYCQGFLGIPIYFSKAKIGMLSLEHTHPPHDSVGKTFSKKLVTEMKERISAAINP